MLSLIYRLLRNIADLFSCRLRLTPFSYIFLILRNDGFTLTHFYICDSCDKNIFISNISYILILIDSSSAVAMSYFCDYSCVFNKDRWAYKLEDPRIKRPGTFKVHNLKFVGWPSSQAEEA